MAKNRKIEVDEGLEDLRNDQLLLSSNNFRDYSIPDLKMQPKHLNAYAFS